MLLAAYIYTVVQLEFSHVFFLNYDHILLLRCNIQGRVFFSRVLDITSQMTVHRKFYSFAGFTGWKERPGPKHEKNKQNDIAEDMNPESRSTFNWMNSQILLAGLTLAVTSGSRQQNDNPNWHAQQVMEIHGSFCLQSLSLPPETAGKVLKLYLSYKKVTNTKNCLEETSKTSVFFYKLDSQKSEHLSSHSEIGYY